MNSRQALALLLAVSCGESFHYQQAFHHHRRSAQTPPQHLRVAASSSYAGGDQQRSDSNRDLRQNATLWAASLADMVLNEQEDQDQAAIDQKREQVLKRLGGSTYRVALPLQQLAGLSVCRVQAVGGSSTPVVELDLDTLRMTELFDDDARDFRIDAGFTGLVVSSVSKDSLAYKEGVRPGDILMAVSATLGDALWPKSTLEGVQSAISSRRSTSESVVLELRRAVDDKANNQYVLTLTKPIGLVLQESEDGYVEVTGFTDSAPKLVKYAVQVGDRVLAVDSSLGDKMWPVSTVEGVISACTSRLPGQSIKMRFERPEGNIDTSVVEPVKMESVAEPVAKEFTPVPDQKTLIMRCRDILRRYSKEESMSPVQSKFKGKFAVPAIVADKVVDALASASASVDCVTLSMIMNAYLSCQQPEGALRIFEAATGFSADGSLSAPTDIVTGDNGKMIVPNESSLNLYTVTALMRAHAMAGDIYSVERVLAAVEGRSGEVIYGVESAPWPWTGSFGSIQPDTQLYNTVLSAAEKIGGKDALDLAMRVFNGMAKPASEERSAKDSISFNTLISALTNAGRYEDAFSMFDQMQRAGVRPDKYTYTSLIKACQNSGDVDELLYDMQERGVQADVVTYNAMIKSLCEARRWSQATKLVTEMEARNVSPDSMTYGYLMNAMLRADKPNACLALFESAYSNAKTTSLTENVHLYTTAVTAAAVLANYERALELISRMSAVGVKPNLKTLTSVIGACLSSGKSDLAVQVFKRIEEPDGYAIVQGIRALCRNGQLDEALDLLKKHSIRGGSLLSGKEIMNSYNEVISSALSAREMTLAGRALSDLFSKGYIPSKMTLETIMDSMDQVDTSQDTTQAEELFRFALFVTDSLLLRKLPIGGRFYATTLFLGNRIGGTYRKVASSLAASKVSVSSNAKKLLGQQQEEAKADDQAVSLYDYLVNYDEEQPAPTMRVQIASRDRHRVLKAESAVLSNSRPRKRQMV